MINQKVRSVLDILSALLPEFQRRRKGDMWKRLALSFAEVFPEDREEIILFLRDIVLPASPPAAAKISKLEIVQRRIKNKARPAASGGDYNCPDCPKSQTIAPVGAKEIQLKKAGRANRLGNLRAAPEDETDFLSAEDVFTRFEGNQTALQTFCETFDISVPPGSSVRDLSAAIFKQYKK